MKTHRFQLARKLWERTASALPLAFGLATLAFASPVLAQAPVQSQPLGIAAKAVDAKIGNATLTEGSTIFSGDYLSTGGNGSLLVRIGALSMELESGSGAHVYRAPYGAVIELDRGTVIYTTPGGQQNLVIVASDVRVTPVLSTADLGRVSINDPCNVTVYSQRGQANVKVGSESKLVEESKSYHVRAESELSYRQYVSPDNSDYHDYHAHKPCVPLQTVKGHAPLAPAQSHFLVGVAVVVGTATGIGVWKSMESASRP